MAGKDGEGISICSDVPYKRYDFWNDEEYYEVLDHGKLDDERLKGGLPILFNHDRDQHLARAAGYVNDGHKVTLDASSFKWASGDLAANKKADMESGALPDTSIGYEITGDGVCIGAKDELPIYKFPFKIYEASLVTIPADSTVGMGRQREHKPDGEPVTISIRGVDSAPVVNPAAPTMKTTAAFRSHFLAPETGGGDGGASNAPVIDAAKERAEALKDFKARCKKIDEFVGGVRNEAWKAKAAEVAAKHKDGDANFDDFRAEALNHFTTETQLDPGSDNGGVRVIGDRPTAPQRSLSVGAQFVRSKDFQERSRQSGRRSVSLEIPDCTMLGARGKASLAQRAGFTSSDLSSVNIQVLPGMVELGMQRLTIMDVLTGGTTNAAALPYAKENGFGTINGAPFAAGTYPRAQAVGEGGLKPTWDADLTTDTANVKKVAVTTKVPDEFMADFPGMQSYIDGRLPYMVDLETEFQLLYGDGTGNNLKGIFANANVQTRAIDATDGSTIAASLKKGLTDIQVGAQFEPSAYAFHPYDWETASLLKDSSGRFLAGGPFYIPFSNGVFVEMFTFWGKPVVITTSVTYGKPLTGAWKLGAQYFMREGMRIETTNANEDDFRRNLIAVRAEHRLALATYRPVAFLEFTGFPART